MRLLRNFNSGQEIHGGFFGLGARCFAHPDQADQANGIGQIGPPQHLIRIGAIQNKFGLCRDEGPAGSVPAIWQQPALLYCPADFAFDAQRIRPYRR